MTENEAIKIATHCLGVQAEQEVCEECDIYGNCHTDCKDVAVVAITALKEIQLYKDGKLCLVPKDVYSKQCCELDAYKEIGTVEECREAVEKQKPKVGIVTAGKSYPIMCPSCGHKMDLAYHYCVFCGQNLIYLQKHE